MMVQLNYCNFICNRFTIEHNPVFINTKTKPNCFEMSENSNKRKRTKNTASQQYELYLEAMENDFVFRSNTMNPSLPPNYIQNKWEELTLQLNGIGGNGPVLTSEEWKKRFIDWKYVTKAKFRKIKCYREKSGGGPSTELKMTTLEERALDVWGRVTVQGAKNVTLYEGVPISPGTLLNESTQLPTDNIDEDNNNMDDDETIFINIENEDTEETIPDITKTPTSKKHIRIRPKPLSVLAENLIKSTEQNITVQSECIQIFKKFAEDYVRLEQEKLNFKIKKFKFLHPDF